jgi:hypothetical protein
MNRLTTLFGMSLDNCRFQPDFYNPDETRVKLKIPKLHAGNPVRHFHYSIRTKYLKFTR